jgi:hypothetical protein
MTARSTVRSWKVLSTIFAPTMDGHTLDRQVDFAELRVFHSVSLAAMLPTTCHEWG